MSVEKTFNLNDPELYINRELSMLAFQERVIEEAFDKTNPLLERIKFLSILGSNLDEFFMVRVGGLRMQINAGVTKLSNDGLTPAEQLAAIRKHALQLMVQTREHLQRKIMPELNDAGIHILDYNELTQKQVSLIKKYFDEVIFPVITPLAFDPGHPFPHISNLSLNLAVVIRDQEEIEHFARIKVPESLPRLLPIKRSSGGVRRDGTVPHHHYFVWVEQVIAANLDALFPGMKVLEVHPFRVTRNADIVIQELEALDLLETMEESVRKRRFGNVVRLTVHKAMPDHILEILIENLRMDPNDVYTLERPLGLSNLMEIFNIDRYDLKDPPFATNLPSVIRSETYDGNIFAAIRQQDLFLHHPYDSFKPVVDFLKSASRDPAVLAIKLCLYRVGSNSPVVDTLLKARRDHGKQVAVLVELKARFDEESNIGWARKLEQEGVHVVYGLLGLKTHSKVALVVRKEGDQIRRYVHLGTGNYNHITARLYEDLGVITCDEDIGADATDLFNYLTGYSSKSQYRKLLVAPINLRDRIEELIEREIEHQNNGEQGHMILKTNALVDKPIMKKLYLASQAGVQVDLLVRGICCLRPGVPGLSENIRVISIVGRFLEHSRIYYFRNGGQEEIYAGSADLMPRNLNQRVEVLFPIQDQSLIRHLRDDVLATYLADNIKARLMMPDGTYKRTQKRGRAKPVYSQEAFLQGRAEMISK